MARYSVNFLLSAPWQFCYQTFPLRFEDFRPAWEFTIKTKESQSKQFREKLKIWYQKSQLETEVSLPNLTSKKHYYVCVNGVHKQRRSSVVSAR
jgi:hypothetical protein